MLKRLVKRNGDELFPLGLGAMRLPTKKGSIDKDVAKEYILYAIDNGLNYIDTAYPYHNGASETFLGEILNTYDSNGVRYYDKVKISTKLPSWLVKSRGDMDSFLNEQLSRLKTDSIDYYFIHNVDLAGVKRLQDLGLNDFLEKSKAEGKIKNIGFSYHGAHEGFNETVDLFDWDMVLVQYNYLDTNVQAGYDGIGYAYSKDIAVFIMEPLKGGLLAVDVPEEAESIFREVDNDRSNVDWALSWILNHKEVTCVLSGMGSISDVKENMAIANRVKTNSFSDEELATVKEVQRIIQSLLRVNCTSCGYCLPCPKGVNIPECFKIYNEKFLFRKKGLGILSNAVMKYFMIVSGITNKDASAGLCNGCGKCKRHCPQSIDIPKELKVVKKEFEKPGFKYQVAFIKNIGLPFVNKVSKVFNFFKDI